MKVQVIAIANDRDYRAAKALMESLMGAETDPEILRLRAQALLIAAWEQAKSPTVPPDPLEAIKFRMEQMGLRPRDLVRTSGTRSRRFGSISRQATDVIANDSTGLSGSWTPGGSADQI